MFMLYSERARRVIFFARYEASQYGSPYIETEHLLLGMFREDKGLTRRFLKYVSLEVVRKQVDGHLGFRPKTPTSIDLPLSNECKRVLAYAAEEAERLEHKNILPAHLLLGLLREENSFAAEILRGYGLELSAVREEMARPEVTSSPSPFWPGRESSVVTITSNPSGAEIEVDGKFLGHTPGEFALAQGEWPVRLTKSCFEPWERKLLVLPSAKQNLSVDLVKLPE